MNVLTWIIFGALAGWVASLIMNTDEDQGALANIIVGIIGALIGGFVMRLFGQSGVTGFNVWSFVVAVIGSIILIAIYKAIRRPANRM